MNPEIEKLASEVGAALRFVLHRVFGVDERAETVVQITESKSEGGLRLAFGTRFSTAYAEPLTARQLRNMRDPAHSRVRKMAGKVGRTYLIATAGE